MNTPEPTVAIRLDPGNPGEYFACCGLLELADRLWKGAAGWFDIRQNAFCIAPANASSEPTAGGLLEALACCELVNTMTPEELQRRHELSNLGQKNWSPEQKEEKKALDARWREDPLVLGKPFDLRLDWWHDDRAGGSRFKTWAGQQSVIEIARGMRQPLAEGRWHGIEPMDWLRESAGDGTPFNFDSNLGAQSANIDVGFSLDPLGMGTSKRPLVEFAALVGLQRFRPAEDTERRYLYTLWPIPLMPEVAAVAACGQMRLPKSRKFAFRLLFRTKYLKSFLPGIFVGGE